MYTRVRTSTESAVKYYGASFLPQIGDVRRRKQKFVNFKSSSDNLLGSCGAVFPFWVGWEDSFCHNIMCKTHYQTSKLLRSEAVNLPLIKVPPAQAWQKKTKKNTKRNVKLSRLPPACDVRSPAYLACRKNVVPPFFFEPVRNVVAASPSVPDSVNVIPYTCSFVISIATIFFISDIANWWSNAIRRLISLYLLFLMRVLCSITESDIGGQCTTVVRSKGRRHSIDHHWPVHQWVHCRSRPHRPIHSVPVQ